MAHDEARAERIRELYLSRPDLTWGRIADAVGVRERSAHYWQETGGIGYETAKKLAKVFNVDFDWLWAGQGGESPDLMAAFAPEETDLERLERRLDVIEQKLDYQIKMSEDYIDEARRTEARRAVIAETVSEMDAAENADALLGAFRRVAAAEPRRRSKRSPSQRQPKPS